MTSVKYGKPKLTNGIVYDVRAGMNFHIWEA